MAVTFVPRAFGGTLILNAGTVTPQPLHYINVTWVTRDMQATWKTRDMNTTWKTRGVTT